MALPGPVHTTSSLVVLIFCVPAAFSGPAEAFFAASSADASAGRSPGAGRLIWAGGGARFVPPRGIPLGRRESRAETVSSRWKGSRSHRGGRTAKEPGRTLPKEGTPRLFRDVNAAGPLPAAPSAAFARQPDEARGNDRRTGGDPPACRSTCDRGEAMGTARQNCSVRIPPKSGRRIRRPLNDIRVDGKRA